MRVYFPAEVPGLAATPEGVATASESAAAGQPGSLPAAEQEVGAEVPQRDSVPGGPTPFAAFVPIQLGEAQPIVVAEVGGSMLPEETVAAAKTSEPTASIAAVAGSEGAASLPPSQPESLSGLVDFVGET